MKRNHAGFTLVELAIVLVIVGLLLAGAVATIDAQSELRARTETQRTLETARDALVGFAVRNGRLPCPATATSGGLEFEWNAATGACGAADGFVPAATLALAPLDASGLLVDGWLNRVRYAVSAASSDNNAGCPPPIANVYTRTNALRNLGFVCIKPDLRVCIDRTCPDPKFDAPAVLYSLGRNGREAPGGSGINEQENTDGDKIFVARELTRAAQGAQEFDDMVLWLSPHVLYARLIAAGAN